MASETTNKKLKACKSCGKEVAKSAKKYPHCGQKLAMGFMMKAFIGLFVIAGIAIALTPSEEEMVEQAENDAAELRKTPASGLSPFGELQVTFNLMSPATDLQRKNMEEEITGRSLNGSFLSMR
ncbi:hypothetical protein [Solemya velum gill symbiont]|uniref:hypothetical protein n=1 Tax=Solemya velum gill symbiont TaxID=2340 RepID=UPI000998AFD3|nr:hypothetical protein [Solemya velum gill symbiont]OOZ43290.1 hypothetical protein BOW37_11575 [Solemya velum gill symbiont]OOZ44284.1 hypothetical protein BOW38_11670 [Solemya velum gill symbiont]OOZ48055.1 hypothetical protein BOW39_12580 [Solemya velum gill symbiont]OOZ49536.1 hypothetical protein BOW40_11610 [Solemya velum gill symbiont]OOZ53075.1 hypothetical protein BOW41_11760 [Solemya velum gill symbiont]